MATQLKNILAYTNVPNGNMVSLAHGLNFNGIDRVPDVVLPDHGGWSFTINATNVEATNNTGGLDSLDVYVEAWHTIDRAFGDRSITSLSPQPFVPNFASSASVPDPYTPPDGTWNVNGGIQITQPAQDAANPIISGLNVIGGAHTDIPDNAASVTTDVILLDAVDRTVNFVGGGAGTILYGPTMIGNSTGGHTLTADAAHTVTIAAAMVIGVPPTPGANVTITQAASLYTFGDIAIAGDLTRSALGGELTLRGIQSAGGTGTDVVIDTLNARTNGELLEIRNSGLVKLRIEFDGATSVLRSTQTGGIVKPMLTLNEATSHNDLGNAEVLGAHFDFSGTLNWATSTTLPEQSSVRFTPPTTFTSDVATKTITAASTVTITGAPPTGGTNLTVDDSYALWVQNGEARFDNGGIRVSQIRDSDGGIVLNVSPSTNGRLGYFTTADEITNATRGSFFTARNDFQNTAIVNYAGHFTNIEATSRITNNNTQNWTNTVGLSAVVVTIDTSAGGSGTITGAAGLYFRDALDGTGTTVTNMYGVYIETPTLGASINDAIHVVGGRTFLGGDLEHAGTNAGFYGTTPAAQQTSGANLTNNVTVGGTNDVIDNWTDLATYATDAAAIRNAVYQLARKLKQVNDGLRVIGLLS